jgi:rhodanese-related sulfurtransferase
VTVDEIDPEAFLLDVRENDEWAAGHIGEATHIPMRELPAQVAQRPDWLTPDAAIVVVCAVGARSAQATAWLNQQGYQAVNLVGGMHAWAQAGRPMISSTGAPPSVL